MNARPPNAPTLPRLADPGVDLLRISRIRRVLSLAIPFGCIAAYFVFATMLIPLIAHDRAGFGGGLCCTGLTVFFCVWCARPSRSLWQALAVAGLTGFATAIGIHPLIGYLSPSHLAPAVAAAALFIAGLILSAGPMGGLRIGRSVGREMQTDRAAERRSTV